MIREKINKIRTKELPDDWTRFDYPAISTRSHDKISKIMPQKFKVGDIVHVALDSPQDVNGNKLSGSFREGDMRWDSKPRKITRVLMYSGNNLYRYMVSDITNASYTDDELFASK